MFAAVLVGLPASGKSTVTALLKQSLNNPFVYSTDSEIEKTAMLQGKTYSEIFIDAIVDAKSVMNNLLIEAINNEQDIIIDQTHMEAEKRICVINTFPNKKYEVHCILIPPPENNIEMEILQKRLDSRPGKEIPQRVIESMIANYEEPTIAEGFKSVTIFKNL